MPAPSSDTEAATAARYLDGQLAAVRVCLLGLTEEHARARPTRSALSLGGIVKHVNHGLRLWVETLTTDPATPHRLDAEAFAAHAASFALTDEETAAGVLADFDALRAELADALASTDPGTVTVEPAAPWDGLFDELPGRRRFLLAHMLEEVARHAGHADILREQLDGVAIPTLVLTERGVPANDFFTPYVPAPGTIGA